MFLDLTYTVRHLLKQIGYDRPGGGRSVSGAAGGHQAHAHAVAGQHLCGADRNQFLLAPGNTFAAQYHEREPPVLDPEPPFSRCFLLPLPEEADSAASREVQSNWPASSFTAISLPPWARRLTWRGPVAVRGSSTGRPARPSACITWTGRSANCSAPPPDGCASNLVQRWLSRDAKPLRKAVQAWIDEQWKKHELGADQFIASLRNTAKQNSAKRRRTLSTTVIAPLIRRYAELAKNHMGGRKATCRSPTSRRTKSRTS